MLRADCIWGRGLISFHLNFTEHNTQTLMHSRNSKDEPIKGGQSNTTLTLALCQQTPN